MDISKNLLALGLSEQKVTETLKNEALSCTLNAISTQACEHGPVNKNVGNLLYNLATRLAKQFHQHLPLLVAYIVEEKINQEAKLVAALKYVQDHSATGIDKKSFERECGIGAEVSQDEIESVVSNVLEKNKTEILAQRYRFNVGPLMGQIRSSLKWADSRKVKEELDLQLLTILGRKLEEDLVGPTKKREKHQTSRDAKTKQTTSKNTEDGTKSLTEKQPCTMKEFIKTIQFHKPGENFKTDGYVINENTHDLLKKHLQLIKGQVRTRFPPEPNGILHIGHAKAININFGYAEANEGVCFLRYDDTNPEKEEEKFFVAIKENVHWLGYEPFQVTHSSDYFGQLYEWAKKLISKNLAFVCHQKPEEVRGRDPPPSPWRNRPVEESMKLFQLMKMGGFDEGEATLRLKLTLEEGKVDPVAYRIKFLAHHRTGDTWCIYPTYDYTHCLCDSIEQITHSLCTKEFQNRRSSYYWLCNSLDIYCPVQWEYGRLNMLYAVVSKRKIAKLIEAGHVRDWDDPRLFTLTALRRRGFPPEAINNFCATLGLTGAQISIHPDALEASVRDVLNTKAQRTMVVLEPLKLKIVNFPHQCATSIEVPNIPGNDSAGTHSILLDREIWIENSDFASNSEKGFRRLTPDQPVGLKHCGFILKHKATLKKPCGEIDYLEVDYEKVTEENKPKAFIHWVAKPVPCEVRLYEKLFIHDTPEDSSLVPGGFLTDINPNSLKINTVALADASLSTAKPFEQFQFERVGFFCVDRDSGERMLVFNRTVSLKEDKGKKSDT